MISAQYRDQTGVWNDLNWFECLIWSQGLILKQSVPRSNRSLKWSELNRVLDDLANQVISRIKWFRKSSDFANQVISRIKAWSQNNQYQDLTGVWNDLNCIKFLRFTDQLYFNRKTWNDLKGRLAGQFYTTQRRSMKRNRTGWFTYLFNRGVPRNREGSPKNWK